MSYFHPLPGTKSADKDFSKSKEWVKQYAKYYRKHQFSLSEIIQTFTNPNPIVRQLKKGGFKKFINYYLR